MDGLHNLQINLGEVDIFIILSNPIYEPGISLPPLVSFISFNMSSCFQCTDLIHLITFISMILIFSETVNSIIFKFVLYRSTSLYILTLHPTALLNLLIDSKSLSIDSTQSCYLLTMSFIFHFPIHMSFIYFSGFPAMTKNSDIMLSKSGYSRHPRRRFSTFHHSL